MLEPQPVRDRYFDLLRVLAIIRVSVFHFFPYAVLELAFPSMGVMFALAGSLMANSLNRGSVTSVVRGRMRRLLPALWVLAAILVPVMFLVGWERKAPLWHLIAWIVPIANPPASGFGFEAAEVLWYLVTYFWLVLASPLLYWLYRRARLLTVALPLAVLAVVTVFPIWPAPAIEEVGVDLLTFATCWILGFAHRDGTLRRIPAWLIGVLAVGCVALALAWGHSGVKEIPLAYAVYNAGFVLALLRWKPDMAWLARRRGLSSWVALINARAVTIYLWNNVAIALCYPVGDALEVWRLGRFFEIGYVATALALLADAVLLFGWVEDLAARRRPRFLPWPHSGPTPAAPRVRSTAKVPDHEPPTMPRMVLSANTAHAETTIFRPPRHAAPHHDRRR
ncbi:acyltransferase family protein [Actinoplanes derwentensis]|uniref:Peptidoglycan/LPS O-acetylase OafA/YrhL, contains acyltransferase and SGNH-hydrolase domains n=1 Tax=Actinoplanes derwentensis TaxID=113562 RepID=A0A1H2B0Z2_9ACTN|nr:acyltransferase [Actinoplanes derwentensis]GID87609.1 integral membrane transferase [Actinoplanes derwentensis]SDT51834.1 Peptidoglycan/LPS O-acetylase OafA/YrhL, contains acyltransferase and SGNH-hydrolase domains [Actinoplanes derwentensis]